MPISVPIVCPKSAIKSSSDSSKMNVRGFEIVEFMSCRISLKKFVETTNANNKNCNKFSSCKYILNARGQSDTVAIDEEKESCRSKLISKLRSFILISHWFKSANQSWRSKQV